MRGIAGRFAGILSLLVLLATGTVGYMVYTGARQSLIESSKDRLAHTVETIKVRFAASLEGIGKDVRFLAGTPPVEGIVRARTLRGLDPETALLDGEWREQLLNLFNAFLANRPSYCSVSFVEAANGGRELVKVEKRDTVIINVPRRNLQQLGKQEFFRETISLAKGTVYLSSVNHTSSDSPGKPCDGLQMQAAIPVYTQGGSVYGLVTIRVNFDELLQTMEQLVDQERSLYVADRNGKLLLVPPSEKVEHRRAAAPPLLQERFPQISGVLQGNRYYESFEDAGSSPPDLRWGYFTPLYFERGKESDNLIVGVTSPQEAVLGGVRRVRERSLYITLLFSVAGIMLALGVAGFMTRPLSQITQAVSTFGRNGSLTSLPAERRDEIGILARAFAGMATKIYDQVRELEDKEKRQRTIFETSAEGIIVTDEYGEIEAFNRAAERLFGYESSEVLGKNISILVVDTGASENGSAGSPEEGASAWQTVGTGREILGRRKDGSRLPLSLSVSVFELAGKRMYAAFLADITERKKYEVALQKAKEQAEEMARLKSAFLANMSHEIRTPLTSVIGYASLLGREVSEQHRRFAYLIERSGRRLMDTLNSVLALAQLEANGVKVELDVIDVVGEVQEIVQLFQEQALRKGLRLKLTISAGKVPRARLDKGALGSILQNLIGNAIKFTDEGCIEVLVGISGHRLQVQVADTGIGIDPYFLPHLFEEFAQESTGISRSYEGAGLGLSITKRLVEIMDGSVSVQSEKGKGSVFTLSFPIVEEEIGTSENNNLDYTFSGLSQSRVLLVEDNSDTAFLILHVLLDVCDVTLASSSEEALHKAQATAYDLALLDINLGEGGNGVEVLTRLRGIPGYENVPMVAVTAYALPGDRENYISLGFDGYLSKPFTVDELLQTAARLITKHAV